MMETDHQLHVCGGPRVRHYPIPIGSMSPRGNNVDFWFNAMADTRLALRLIFVLTSTCNQAVTVQVVGADDHTPREDNVLSTVQATQSLGAGSTAMTILRLPVDLDGANWHNFMGLKITTGGTGPTSGEVVARAYMQAYERD